MGSSSDAAFPFSRERAHHPRVRIERAQPVPSTGSWLQVHVPVPFEVSGINACAHRAGSCTSSLSRAPGAFHEIATRRWLAGVHPKGGAGGGGPECVCWECSHKGRASELGLT